MASTLIAEISREDLQTLDAPTEAKISDVENLSSYNWIEAPAQTPTIAVPGSPPLWSPLPMPRRLPKDSGLVYISQNAARNPDSPLEPLFRALYVSRPSFDIRSVDAITDRNNIRKLLSFVDPSTSRNGLEPFTIDIEVIGDTLVLNRNDPETHTVIGPAEFRGFGHEFEKAYTTRNINDSTGHHRIISYCFGGLKFIIRYETDAYVGGGVPSSEGDSLSSMLGSMSLSSATGHCSTPLATGSKLAVRREGQVVSLESTLEIKTRVSHKSLPIEEVAAQLWVSQTPKLVRAYHRNGTFEDPRVEDVAGVVKEWESDHQPHLRKLVALISRILSVVKEWAGARNATLKYDAAGDKLVILTADEKKKLLPDDLYGMWVDAGNLCADVREESKNTDKSAVESKTQTPVHADTPFFEVINYSVVNGYRHFFRRMPLSLSQYHVLHDSLELLGIDVLQNQTISNIMHDFRAAKDDYDSGERRQIRGPKSVARDAAFRLIYIKLETKTRRSMRHFSSYPIGLFSATRRGR